MKPLSWSQQLLLVHVPFILFATQSVKMSHSLVIPNGRTHQRKMNKSSRLDLAQDSDNNESNVGNQGVNNEIERQAPKQPRSMPSRSSNPTAKEMMTAMGTSPPRRIFLSSTSSAGIALVGNLFGITSSLLTYIDEDIVESTGLDTYYPRGDFKRYRTADYTFVIPKEWVADTAVELAKAQRKTQPLDYRMRQTTGGILPDAAFGPPGRLDSRGVSKGDTNVSVIQSAFLQGFLLRETMKTPTEGALFLLNNSIAPPESGRKATLHDASEKNGIYQFEYTIDRGDRGLPLRSISVLAQAERYLYTLTVVAPEKDWTSSSTYEEKLRKIAESFHLR